MEYNTIITLLSLLLCLLIFCRSVIFRQHAAKYSDALLEMRDELDAIKEKECRDQEFQHNLQQAEVVNELQKSRSVYSNKNGELQAPERYGYAQSMFQSGMQTDKIAHALGMSSHETNQLFKLARINIKDEPTSR